MSSLLLNYLRKFPLDYGKNRLAARVKVPATPSLLFTTGSGVKMNLDLREYQMKQIYLYGWYEKNTLRHLLKMARPDWTFVDVGANVGFYSLTLAQRLTQGSVHAFEPNPGTFDTLAANAALNTFPHLHLHSFGLSDATGTLTLTFDPHNLGTASAFKTEGSRREVISLRALDEVCETEKIGRVDLIKVDIEGGEMNFIKGATETLRRNRQLVLVAEIAEENCRRAGYTGEELFNRIAEMGFRAFVPRSWPFGLRPVSALPADYHDNILFVRN